MVGGLMQFSNKIERRELMPPKFDAPDASVANNNDLTYLNNLFK